MHRIRGSLLINLRKGEIATTNLTTQRVFACLNQSTKQRRALVFVKRSCSTQTVKPVSSSFFIARNRWREKERALKLKNERLDKPVDSYKEELRGLKEECHVSSFLKVVSDAEEGDVKAAFLFDQFKNWSKKKKNAGLRRVNTKALHHLQEPVS